MTVLGIDGCPGGWVVASTAISDRAVGHLDVRRADTADLVALARGAAVVAIDIPGGLLERGARVCDVEARRLLGPRRSSAFIAPTRTWLPASTYADARRRVRRTGDACMSVQAFNLAGKVREIDAVLRRDRALRRKTFEVHPEMSFLLLNGGSGISSKHSARGRAIRRRLLERAFGRAIVVGACKQPLPGVSKDDVLDAMAAAWSAWRIARGAAIALPARIMRDAHGLRMCIFA